MMQRMCFFFVLFAIAVSVKKSDASGIVMSWNASVSQNVIGYNVYYGTTSGIYSYEVDAGNATSLSISNLTPGVTYYFVATAYDADGDESFFSGETSYTIPATVAVTLSATSGSPGTMQFQAELGHWYEIQATTDFLNWSSIWQSDVALSDTVMQFTDPDSGTFASRFYRLVLH